MVSEKAEVMVLKPGELIHVIHRQMFEGDARRHFAGSVEVCTDHSARVNGYLYAMDNKLNQFVKRETIRTRIVPLNCGSVIINVLPEHVHIDQITYKYQMAGDIIVTDGSDWHLDVTHL